MPAEGIDLTSTIRDPLVIAGREFRSRLITGTGKYPSFEVMREAVVASECELVTSPCAASTSTATPRRSPTGFRTASCSCRTPRAARPPTKQCGSPGSRAQAACPDWIKLEVIPDPQYLLPDGEQTLEAARTLVEEGFTVLPYVQPDPVLRGSSRMPVARR